MERFDENLLSRIICLTDVQQQREANEAHLGLMGANQLGVRFDVTRQNVSDDGLFVDLRNLGKMGEDDSARMG